MTEIRPLVQDGKLIQQKSGPFGSLKDAHNERQSSLPAGNDPAGRSKSFNPCMLQRVSRTLPLDMSPHLLIFDFQKYLTRLLALEWSWKYYGTRVTHKEYPLRKVSDADEDRCPSSAGWTLVRQFQNRTCADVEPQGGHAHQPVVETFHHGCSFLCEG